jgi:hypothetical protein
VTRVARQLATAAAVGLLAGVATVLGLAAAADVWPGSTPVLVALASIWVSQGIRTVYRTTRSRSTTYERR